MATGATGPILERTYDSSHPGQWNRELVVNASEAEAKRIVFTTEWEAVRELGVHRRLVWDDGNGMEPNEMKRFLNTYGGGGKPIGDRHENFGVGFKTSTLPWNKNGIVVASLKNGYESMMVLKYFPADNEDEPGNYGAVVFDNLFDENGERANDDTVCAPGFYEGIDYSVVIPQEIRDVGHGTVFVLLGNTGKEDTILGDPSRPKENDKYYWGYINERFFDLNGDIEVAMREYGVHTERRWWPLIEDHKGGHWPGTGPGTAVPFKKYYGQYRYPRGIMPLIKGASRMTIASQGTTDVSTEDGISRAKVHWMIVDPSGTREEITKGNPGMSAPGTIAALYRNELYDTATSGRKAVARYNRFGVYLNEARERMFMFIEPEEWDKVSKIGAYPDESRSRLLITGGTRAGEDLPWDEWGADFIDKMPTEVEDLLKAVSPKSSGSVANRLKRLMEEYATRFKTTRERLAKKGEHHTTPTHTANPESKDGKINGVGTTDGGPSRGGGCGGSGGGSGGGRAVRRKKSPGTTPIEGDTATTTGNPSTAVKVESDLPNVEFLEITEFAEYTLPATVAGKFVPEAGKHGTVYLNRGWQVYEETRDQLIKNKGHLYDPADLIVTVETEYKFVALAKVAHAISIASLLDPIDREQMLNARAITTALSGFYAEERLIADAVGGLTKKKFKPPVLV